MDGPQGLPMASADVTDQVAVDRVRAGDQDAYAILVRRYAAAAHRAAFIFGAGPDAEDVVQVAFVKAYEALPRFRDGGAAGDRLPVLPRTRRAGDRDGARTAGRHGEVPFVPRPRIGSGLPWRQPVVSHLVLSDAQP